MPQSQTRENPSRLELLAAAHFKRKLTDAEANLLKSAPSGALADCGVPGDPKDPAYDPNPNDPSKAETWGPDREIAAELIRWLCVDPKAKKRVDPGGIWVQRAKITGKLNLDFTVVLFPIRLWHCSLTGDVSLNQVEMPRLSLQASWTKSINADSAVIKGNLFLRNGFHAEGEVNVLSARIGGSLECNGGTFHNPGRKALVADRVEVRGNVFLSHGFHADGEVRLLGAQIGGDLDCHGGVFNNPVGFALNADGASVKGYVFLREGFLANGEVNLLGAAIGESLECNGGVFNNPGRDALCAERAEVKGNVFLNDFQKRSFTANGGINLRSAKIGGGLVLQGGDLRQADLDLRGAAAAGLMDDWGDGAPQPNCWPPEGKLHLDGFVYDRIDKGSRNPEVRLAWLKLQPEKPFAAQPYLHLSEVVRAHGDDDGAIGVLVAMEDRRRAASVYPNWAKWCAGKAEGVILKATIGYGYRPLGAFRWILGLTVLSCILYGGSFLAGGMVPTEKEAYGEFKSHGKVPAHYPAFSPVIYSVENSLPLVKLGQADKWQPDPAPAVTQPPPEGRWMGIKRFGGFIVSPQFLRWFLWFQILLGWLLATLFLAGVSGVIRKD